jgi:hypothetical protein
MKTPSGLKTKTSNKEENKKIRFSSAEIKILERYLRLLKSKDISLRTAMVNLSKVLPWRSWEHIRSKLLKIAKRRGIELR